MNAGSRVSIATISQAWSKLLDAASAVTVASAMPAWGAGLGAEPGEDEVADMVGRLALRSRWPVAGEQPVRVRGVLERQEGVAASRGCSQPSWSVLALLVVRALNGCEDA